MKTKTEKKFDSVAFMRGQRERLSAKLIGKTKEEIVKYFKTNTTTKPVKPSA